MGDVGGGGGGGGGRTDGEQEIEIGRGGRGEERRGAE